jgi:hypothetical protein
MYISSAYKIPIAFQSTVLQVKFKYKVVSGTPVMGGTSSNTYAAAIYDVDNNAWMPLAGAFNFVQSSGVGTFTGTTQVPYNSTQFQIAIYNPIAPTGASSLYLDDFYVGPQVTATGPAMSDAKLYTPTLSTATGSITNTTASAYWMQVGQNIKVNGQITFSAASAAFTTLYVSLPSGFSVNDSAIASSNQIFCGIVRFGDTGVNNYLGVVRYVKSSAKIELVSTVTNTSDAGSSADPAVQTAISNTTPFTYNSGDIIDFSFELPIVGWSSNSVMSADTDTRVVALSRACGTQISVPNTTYTYIDFTSANVDTHGAWRSGVSYNSGTGAWTTSPAYVVPVAGIYHINCSFLFGPSTGSKQVLINKNGSSFGNSANDATTTSSTTITTSATGSFVAGDLIQVALWQNSGAGVTEPGSISAAWSHLEIQRLSGPAVITATDTVAAFYQSSSTALSSTAAAITYATKVNDTTGSYSGSTYTAPVVGVYNISALIAINFTAATVNQYCALQIYKNGSSIAYNSTNLAAGMIFGLTNVVANGVKLVTGDTIQIYGLATPSSPTNNGQATQNYFSITKVG